MKGIPATRRLLLAKCALATAFFLFVAYLVATLGSPPADGTMAFEFRKYLVQFLTLVAIGAVVKYMLQDAVESRDEQRRQSSYEVEHTTSLLTQLSAVYRDVKDARLTLGLTRSADLTKAEYTEAMKQLRRSQGALEELQEDVTRLEPRLVHLTVVPDGSAEHTVRRCLACMEDYLGRLTDEWRTVALEWKDGSAPICLERLDAFTARTGSQADFQVFRGEFQRAEGLLLHHLMKPGADR